MSQNAADVVCGERHLGDAHAALALGADGDVGLCLLLNRRTKTIRVIDFRAGALPAKRLFIQSVAHREGIDKVIILVEKDEVSSWTRVGFVREGTVPGSTSAAMGIWWAA